MGDLPNDEEFGKLGAFLPKEFLDKIVDGKKSKYEHLCQSCDNNPICIIARSVYTTYESSGIGQIVVTCPFKYKRRASGTKTSSTEGTGTD